VKGPQPGHFRLPSSSLRSRIQSSCGTNFGSHQKNLLTVSRPLSGYVSCVSPPVWAVAEWIAVAGPLVIGGQGSGVLSIGTCWFRDFLPMSGLCAS
jgi:hypothetical protein